ncbi:MAG: peptidoglycan-binding protein, partial [Lachnospiraceae bacterium]|nr:peptidoglycan-binding protein [Lachnospiraceae bacterium]
PIQDATVTISYTGVPDVTIEKLSTNSSGQTETVELPAPPIEYSLTPVEQQPYSEYNIQVEAPGYEPVMVSGTEILPDVTALQPIEMNPLETTEEQNDVIVIPDHTLYGEYPPKIPEDEIKPVDESGEIVLSRVVIPEYVVVHDGTPGDTTAPNFYVRYRDYIKNVVSSEIYATWPENAIYANTLVIMSFTLNRVYTEWYRNQGYNFTITSSTAYDQKWMRGRNSYGNIDRIVDSVFANYLSRPGVRQPIFTSYCDGRRVTCDGLSQWGSKYLAEEGYSAIEIIRYYYGSDMYINTAQSISGVPSSWPGYNLTIGSTGDKVRQIQQQLNRIAQNYPAIPKVTADGVFGPATANAVKTFQGIFNLPPNGIVDYPTWYSISNIYVGVSRIAEPG